MRFRRTKEVGIYGLYHRGVLVYVGSSVNIVNRYSWHKAVLKNKYHSCAPLQAMWTASRGRSWEFRILELCSEDQLLIREQHYFDTVTTLVNQQRIAGSAKGMTRSLETIAKLEKAARERVRNPEYIAKLSARVKRQHQEKNFGQDVWTDETKIRNQNTPIRPNEKW